MRGFIELLKDVVEDYKVNIASYCLLTNHYHLLIQTPQGNISRSMRHLNGVYTQRYNRLHHCDGQLFRGRFDRRLKGEMIRNKKLKKAVEKIKLMLINGQE